MAQNNTNDINNGEQEIWVPVPDEPFNKTFMISNMGRIKNINSGNIKNLTYNKSTGYNQVRLDMGKKVKKITYQIHQLVARMFIGPCPENNIVNHKDLNKTNNCVSNLEYLSHSDNRKHYIENQKKINTNNPPVKIIKQDTKVIIDKKDIPGFSKYQVGKDGNIYKKSTGELKAPFGLPDGYNRYSLVPDNIVDNKSVIKKYGHRIVAEAFIPNPNNLPFVNHINANRKDNRVENLEWCTASDNMFHDSKLRQTGKKIQAFNSDGTLYKEYNSIKEAGRDIKIDSTNITKVLSGVRTMAGGYTWKQINNIEEVADKKEDNNDDIVLEDNKEEIKLDIKPTENIVNKTKKIKKIKKVKKSEDIIETKEDNIDNINNEEVKIKKIKKVKKTTPTTST